jgi:UDP-glucose 4-epimerase
MRIFITGGTGFIGIHLCKKLLELNHNVTVYDNFSNSSQISFLSLIDRKVNLITGDILDSSKLEHSMNNHDVVIHLAAKISVSQSIKNPQETFDVNVCGTQNVLESCAKNNISKIIAISTAAVYQNISEKMILDETSPVKPLSPYGESKLEMEKIILDFSSKYKIDAIILRLFNVYGIGQSLEYAGVITKFYEKLQNNSPLIIFGDGTAVRDFVHVDDVINSIILSISYSSSFTYNIASGTSTSIYDLAKTMIALSHKDLKILNKPSRTGEIMFSAADISLAEKNLGFIPKISLISGLEQFMSQ